MMIKKETLTANKQVVHQYMLLKSALVSIYVFPDTAWMTKEGKEFNRTSSQTNSRRKVLKKIAERCASMVVLIGRNPEETYRYSINRLLPITALLETLQVYHLQGLRLNLTSELYLRHADEESGSEEDELPAIRSVFDVASDDGDSSSSPNHSDNAVLLNSISKIRRELPEPCLGWPLLRRKTCAEEKHEDRDTSVVEWVMNRPNRVTTLVVDGIALHSGFDVETNTDNSSIDSHETESIAEEPVSSSTSEPSLKPGWPLLWIAASTTSDSSLSEPEDIKMSLPLAERMMNIAIQSKEVDNHVQVENSFPTLRKMPNDLELRCKQFTLGELKQITSGFSTENLIGEGGCSNVYKGFLPDDKQVAVKILKSYKEATSDFSLEVDIVSSLKHKHITPLIGVCVENYHLVAVYDFVPRGSLQEILHGQSKKSVLPWEVRFKMAIAIAEALHYLHNECSPPVIHRDVKSSNILLSDDFQPQLSDFGLAIRGPIDSSSMIDNNVVGTFGYMAPEYFMEGRVSDKIDIYSFGVVLLELLSGRRPISSKAMEKQESLIQWGRALLERRDLQGLVDPALDGDFDIAQTRRMILAATLCLNQSDTCRPKASEVLEILREKEPTEGYHFNATYMKSPNNQEDYGFCKLSERKKFTRRSKTKSRRLMLKEYFKKEQY